MKVLTYLVYGSKREYQLGLALGVLSALQFLKESQDAPSSCTLPIPAIQRDFRQFAPSRIAALSWLKPSIQQGWMQFWQAS